ncbi:MAG: NAD-dependent epimerase/dehydratase family protein [Anaerolinea sp.]|nr:NAD-dependent epimerase/dehydratase family protein [Anaerolinea sp.]MCC6975606.1 NAD-dependent epimerase/dehydratase family protein [Anaerolineae bacterium]CAG0950013.1 threonine 3-dehydrogenase [Anaerolineae bacterium]
MSTRTILITGANGEIGHGLIDYLATHTRARVVALDLHPLDESLYRMCYRTVIGDITEMSVLESLSTGFDFDTIFHLAALLSTRSERQPPLAHRVNVNGTLNLLEIAVLQARLQGREIKFIFPSSIAVYGLPDLATKAQVGKIKEHEWCQPRTMYGINKLYTEQLGGYYARYYRQLDADERPEHVDFRSIRFPGIISAHTLPTGGTSDFAPEMLHNAAQGKAYPCFVREDTCIPFMVMPDAVRAITLLEAAPRDKLSRQVYNVGAFNPSAEVIRASTLKAFPRAEISFVPDLKRQNILDSWPLDVDDSAAQQDWNWHPEYDLERAFSEYLIPAITERYHQ